MFYIELTLYANQTHNIPSAN